MPAFLIAAALMLALVSGLFLFSIVETWRLEARFPPQGAFVAVTGGRLHYTERMPAGTPKATVLLLHGASGNQADMMLALGDRLASTGYRVIAIDRPGHGWSDRPDGPADASPARQALLIHEAMARLGVTRALIVAHSWAGALAETFALDHAGFAQGLILVAPVTHPWPGGTSWYYAPASTPVIGDIFTRLFVMPLGLVSLQAGVASVSAPNPPPPDYADRTAAWLVLRPSEFVANAQDVQGLKPFVTEQAKRLGAITAPVAIVSGDSDGIVYTHIHSQGSARDIPGATLTVLPGVGHAVQWAQPDAVIAAVEEVYGRGK